MLFLATMLRQLELKQGRLQFFHFKKLRIAHLALAYRLLLASLNVHHSFFKVLALLHS